MKEYTLISSDNDLKDYRNYLEQNNVQIVAMDFEGESNLHMYGEKLCLIQIFDGIRYFVIDALAVSGEKLQKVLESRRVMKLFYDAGSDAMIVYKQYGIKMQSIYDLKLLVDVLEFEKKGLDAVISKVTGINIEKKKKFQRYNWTLRPVDTDAMQYALSDVEYLFVLKEKLFEQIQCEDKTEKLIFSIINSERNVDRITIPRILKSTDYKYLNGTAKSRFKEILEYREEIAKNLNFPPDWVLAKAQLFKLAKDKNYLTHLEFDRRIPQNIRNELINKLESI